MMLNGIHSGRMIGQLHEHPLAELIHETSVAGLSGALRLEQERLKTVVYVADGEVIYAASNLRVHRLAECVRRWQVLSAEQLAELPAGASDLDFAAALINEQALSREALEALRARQLTEILRPVLLWTTGTWEFDARVRMAQDMRVGVEMSRLLLEAARRLPADFTASRFSDPEEKLFPENAQPNLELMPAEAFVLSRIDAPLTLSELLSISTLPEVETKQIVYALSLSRLVKRERWPLAFSPETLERARSVKTTQKIETSASASEKPSAAKASNTQQTPAPVVVETEAAEEFGLDEFFARLARAGNHYEVLGVRRSASSGDIKSSYHNLAKRFHPDRFYNDADATLRARIEEAFARVAQAYETLKGKQTRATYDLKLSQAATATTAQSASAVSSKQDVDSGSSKLKNSEDESRANASSLLRQAEESFGRGLLALRQSKPSAAIASFAEAARLAPQEARYRAYYGRALAENESTRRQAEAELKVAVALDSNNALYHVMLAELYMRIGLPRRAQSEAERALAIDAHNTAARQLLNTLQATPKG